MNERKGQGSSVPQLGWWDSGGWALSLIVAYMVLASLPVALAFAYGPTTGAPFWRELGKGAGMFGFALLALQFPLSGRFRLVDRSFGLDVVMRFHKVMAVFAGVLLLLHPASFVISARTFRLLSFETPWQLNLGKAALLLLTLVIAFALLAEKLRVDYQIWRASHKVVIVVLTLGFVHSLLVGSDMRSAGLRVYWWVLFGEAALIFLYRNAFVALWGRRRLRVTGVKQETHDTYTIALEPAHGKVLVHAPGQFWFLKLQRPGRRSEEHPFTISSSPTGEPPMTSTIKESGDYTKTIGVTRPGDGALVEGPYGRFSLVYHEAEAFLFIAGGVGITPIMSMLRCLRDAADPRPAVLLYGNKTEQDIIFRRELDDMGERLQVVHVLGQAPSHWAGPRGYVTEGLIRQHAGHVLERAHVYLCGPPPMMDKVIRALRALGVPDERIHYERFAI